MVAHVVAFQGFPDSRVHGKMMSGVVRQVIAQVTDDETGEKRSNPIAAAQNDAKEQVEKAVEQQRQWNAHHRRHNQAGLALRLRMMHPMEQKVYFLLRLGFGTIVKHKAVQ